MSYSSAPFSNVPFSADNVQSGGGGANAAWTGAGVFAPSDGFIQAVSVAFSGGGTFSPAVPGGSFASFAGGGVLSPNVAFIIAASVAWTGGGLFAPSVPVSIFANFTGGGLFAPIGTTPNPAGSTQSRYEIMPDIRVTPLGYQQITNLAAATGLTVPDGANICTIEAETQDVRYRDDGVNPTASVGIPLSRGTLLTYTGSLSAIKFIQQAGGAIINVSYYKIAG